jgi:hypothetical protein
MPGIGNVLALADAFQAFHSSIDAQLIYVKTRGLLGPLRMRSTSAEPPEIHDLQRWRCGHKAKRASDSTVVS